MEKFFLEGNTHTKDAKKCGKEIKVARVLIQRIIGEDYSDPYFNRGNMRNSIKRKDMLLKQDVNYLFDLLKRKIQTWWD